MVDKATLLRKARGISGAAASAAKRFIPNRRVWCMLNLDDHTLLQGQFEAEGVQQDIGANWASFTSLNRQHPILQFLNGEAQKVSFEGRFFRAHALDRNPDLKLDLLKSWTRIQESLRRPPIVQFYVGDGHLTINAVITSIQTRYNTPDAFGAARDLQFSVSLMEFHTFSLTDEKVKDTRYARAQEGDYFESLAQQEYGNPMIGDVIRKMHPHLHTLVPGDIVKLPSIEGVRLKEVKQTSVPLKSGFGRRDTPQKRLRQQFFDKRSKRYVSHV